MEQPGMKLHSPSDVPGDMTRFICLFIGRSTEATDLGPRELGDALFHYFPPVLPGFKKTFKVVPKAGLKYGFTHGICGALIGFADGTDSESFAKVCSDVDWFRV
jgi:hypothetical protein